MVLYIHICRNTLCSKTILLTIQRCNPLSSCYEIFFFLIDNTFFIINALCITVSFYSIMFFIKTKKIRTITNI